MRVFFMAVNNLIWQLEPSRFFTDIKWLNNENWKLVKIPFSPLMVFAPNVLKHVHHPKIDLWRTPWFMCYIYQNIERVEVQIQEDMVIILPGIK